MPQSKPGPPLDYQKIIFPSDTVTVGQIRRENPELFKDPMNLLDYSFDKFQIAFTLVREMALAKRAYALAMGKPDPFPGKYNAMVDVTALNAEYRHFKLSTGMHQTKQLVRNIETAAKEQAEQHSRGRG